MIATSNLRNYGLLRNHLLKSNLTGVFLFYLIFVVGLSLLKPNFATSLNIEVIINSFAVTAVVGLSQMTIVATGGMNLSVGSIGGLAAVISGIAMATYGVGSISAVLLGLLVGVFCGLINGGLVTRLGSTSAAAFLVTLAMSSAFRGVNFGMTRAQPIYHLDQAFKDFGNGKLFGLPAIFYVMITVAVLIALVFRYTGLGRQILSFGSNPRAAQLYGVSASRTLITANVISGLLAACAGLMLMARLGSAQSDIGSNWMMFSFAAPIIGGTRLAGGKVSTLGAALGALVLATIEIALVHLNIDVYWMRLIEGLIILLAVTMDLLRGKQNKAA